ncbi:MAG TPA: NUDIX hydrolase [Gemmatimonadaceae bacterium]|nr:NUDIX hydrolase [Gemmatimonadaceae bacterium]
MSVAREEQSDVEVGRVKTRRAYTGRIISLDVDTVRFPDGSVGELEMIRHPGASAVVPFLSDPAGDDPQILLIRQYRYAAEDYLYEIPAGRLDDGEDPIQCAARELKEETGCSAAHFEHMFTMYTTPGFTDEKIHLFLAAGLKRGEAARESDEFLTLTPVPLSKALEMVEAGEIQDAKTALGLLYAAGFRAGR